MSELCVSVADDEPATLRVVGAAAALGAWQPAAGVPLPAAVRVPPGRVEFKLVRVRDALEWEPGVNRVVTLRAGERVRLRAAFGEPGADELRREPLAAEAANAAEAASASASVPQSTSQAGGAAKKGAAAGKRKGAAAKRKETTGKSKETTGKSKETTTKSKQTTTKSKQPTAKSKGKETTAKSQETTATSQETTAKPKETMAKPEEAAVKATSHSAAPAVPAPVPNVETNVDASNNKEAPSSNQSEKRKKRQQGILEALLEVKAPTGNANDHVQCVAFHASQPLLAIARSTHVQVWNFVDHRLVYSTPPFTAGISCVAFDTHRTQTLMCIGLVTGDIYLADLAQQQIVGDLKGKHTSAVRCMAFHHSFPWLVSGSDDTTIRFWDLLERKDLFLVTGHRYSVRHLEFARHRPELLVSASLDRTARIWDVAGVMRAPPLGAIICIANISTASVPRAHQNGVAFAAMPQPNLLVSADVDGALKLFQLTGAGVGDPGGAEAYVDVSEVAMLRPPRQPELVARESMPEPPMAEEAFYINSLPLPLLDRGKGVYRGAQLLHFGVESAHSAVIFANDGVAYIATMESVPDEEDKTELLPVIEPVCFTIMGGPDAAALAPIDQVGAHAADASGALGDALPQYPPVAMIAAHSQQPLFAVVHQDGLVRVMHVTPLFTGLKLVQRATQNLHDEKTWLATISRQPTAAELATAFAQHADRFGVSVRHDSSSRSKFTARLRVAPRRVLEVKIGLNEDGQRVMQGVYSDEHDGQMWRDLLRSFALHVLSQKRWLVTGKRRAIDGSFSGANTEEDGGGQKTGNSGDAAASSCSVQ